MTRGLVFLITSMALGLAGVACSGGDKSQPTGSGGSAGEGAGGGNAGEGASAGNAGAGNGGSGGHSGSTGGGTGGGATGGQAGASGGPAGGQCSPGVTYSKMSGWSGSLRLCSPYDATANGITPGAAEVQAIRLPEPMVAGSTYTLSVDVEYNSVGQTVEFWGSGSLCGAADEKLASMNLAMGVQCTEFHPTRAHDSVLMVWYGDGSVSIGDIAVCAHGKCP